MGCGCKGRVLVYNTSPREVLAVALSVGQPLHIIPIAASTGKLTYLQSLQPKLAHGVCFPLFLYKKNRLLPCDMETQQRHGPHSLCHTCRRTESSRTKVTRGYRKEFTHSALVPRSALLRAAQLTRIAWMLPWFRVDHTHESHYCCFYFGQ